MKNYLEIVLKYIKKEKRSVFPVFISMIITVTLLTTIVVTCKNNMLNNFEKLKLEYGNYDARIMDLDKDKVDKLINNENIKDYALGRKAEVLVFERNITDGVNNFPWIVYKDMYAISKTALDKYFAIEYLKGNNPTSGNEIIVAENALSQLGERLDVGSKIKLKVRENSKISDMDYIKFEDEDQQKVNEIKSTEGDLKADEYRKYLLETKYGKIQEREEEFTIAGVYKSDEKNMFLNNSIIRLLTEEEISSKEDGFQGLVRYKDLSKEKDVAKELGINYKEPTVIMGPYGYEHTDVAYPGYSREENSLLIRNTNSLLILGIIIMFSLICVFNTFNTSVARRIKYYGILRAIGGDNSQISKLIWLEAFIVYISAIPIGVILGYGLVSLEKYFVGDILGFVKKFIIYFDFEVIGITLMAAAVILIVSILIALKREASLTPIEAITGARGISGSKVIIKNIVGDTINLKNNGDIDEKATKYILDYEAKTISYRTIKKLFKFEGELAGINVSRDSKTHRVSEVSLIVIMCMMLIFSYYFQICMINVNQVRIQSNWNAIVSSNTPDSVLDHSLIEKLEGVDGVEAGYGMKSIDISLVEPVNNVNENLIESVRENYIAGRISKDNSTAVLKGRVSALEENTLKLYGDLDIEKLNNGGVILVSKANSYYRVPAGSMGFATFFNKSNPVLKSSIGSDVKYTHDLEIQKPEKIDSALEDKIVFDELNIIGITEEDLLDSVYDETNYHLVDREVTFLTTEEGLKKIGGEIVKDKIYLNVTNSSDRDEVMNKISMELASNGKYILEDNISTKQILYDNARESLGINIIICIVLILMVILNIVNTMTASIINRSVELASMRAIGMTEHQQRRMILGELVFIAIVSLGVTCVTMGMFSFVWQYENMSYGRISGFTILLADVLIMGTVVILTILTSIAPLSKLKKLSIVESIKQE